jgi:hypothetical protein
MKVKELTLDDLVYGLYPNGQRYPHPFRIAAVDIYPTNKSPRIVTVGGYGFQEEHLEPIPLTAEILEQNGFKKKGNRYGIYDDYFDFEMHEYNDGTWLVSYHCCEMSLPDEQLLICYIHQLQHFMRHCGIEKEIEL